MIALPVSAITCFVTSILSDSHLAHYQNVTRIDPSTAVASLVLGLRFVCMFTCMYRRMQKCIYVRIRIVTANVPAFNTQ
jgi:hypothetical protein